MKHPCQTCIVQATCYVGCTKLWGYYSHQKVMLKKYHKFTGRFLNLSIIVTLVWAVLVFTETVIPTADFSFTYRGETYNRILHLGPYIGSLSLALFSMGMSYITRQRIRATENSKCKDFIFKTMHLAWYFGTLTVGHYSNKLNSICAKYFAIMFMVKLKLR